MFGKTLKELRMLRGISRGTLSIISGVNPSSIYSYETKNYLPKTTGTVLLLSKALNVDKQILLDAVCHDDDIRGGLIWA